MSDMSNISDELNALDSVNALDLAFVVDTTGSMSRLIADARSQMIAMIEALRQTAAQGSHRNAPPVEAERSEREGGTVDLRLGVVEYRDHPPQDPMVFRAHPFTGDMEAARSAINGLTANGGGDGPEAVLDGVWAACHELAWRPHARRIAVLVGDSPPHGVGAAGDSFATGCPCGETIASVTAAAEEARVTLYAIGLTTAVTASFGALARYTGGELFTVGRQQEAIERLKAILTEEFGNLEFDRRLLAAWREAPGTSLDTLAERLESSRPAVSAAVSRLGARELLSAH